MKILMLSIFAPHFFNWTEQLRNSGHEVYWLDINDSDTYVNQIDFVHQITGWRYKWNYPGRYLVKSKMPKINRFVNILNERNFQIQLEKQIKRIKPDLVHSFVMYLGGVTALPVMKKFPKIKWAYTAWGSDMYYYQNKKKHLKGIKDALPYFDYMFADCYRDYKIALTHGFKGKFLGVFPGGGGFEFAGMESYIEDSRKRNIILIKGYQGLHGKCISVLQAIEKLKRQLKEHQIVVFGAHPDVFDFIRSSSLKKNDNLEVFGIIPNQEIMELMGKSAIYIGNSSSDGMPNTLLEAIVMGVFPIQSNPGGATEEYITHYKNGFLIENPEDEDEIANHLLKALKNPEYRNRAVAWNSENIKPNLERGLVKTKVLNAYQKIESEL
jgi:glycosyltransferase involved in cell wall biosynthesis